MNREEQHARLLKFQAAGERLKSNDDFKLYIQETEKDLARVWYDLAHTRTTDPRIAELQGNLERLEIELGRVNAWLKEYNDFVKDLREKEIPETEDYSVG